MLRWWPEPTAGDIAWCHFPDDIHPPAKPRPALILAVFDGDGDGDEEYVVRVVYGTSQRTTALSRGKFAILQSHYRAAYEMAGLSYDTKFDLKQTLDLPYSSDWFSVAPAAPWGQTPKLGVLHPSMVRTLEAAYRASRK
jgi:hypothetical protein